MHVCLFLFVLVFLTNGESGHHRIESAYSVHHGNLKRTDGAGFDRFSIGAAFGFVVPDRFEGPYILLLTQSMYRRTPERF